MTWPNVGLVLVGHSHPGHLAGISGVPWWCCFLFFVYLWLMGPSWWHKWLSDKQVTGVDSGFGTWTENKQKMTNSRITIGVWQWIGWSLVAGFRRVLGWGLVLLLGSFFVRCGNRFEFLIDMDGHFAWHIEMNCNLMIFFRNLVTWRHGNWTLKIKLKLNRYKNNTMQRIFHKIRSVHRDAANHMAFGRLYYNISEELADLWRSRLAG